ncbi:MAG: hypothetical protein WDM92_07445 [Caulobacteraceae bacterium]
MSETPPRFALDRHVPLGLVLAVVLQASAVLLWAGRAAARIDELSQRLDRQGPVAERLARLEEQAAGARASLDRIEAKLDRLEDAHGR